MTYQIELTEEQLKALACMIQMAEIHKTRNGAGCLDNVEVECFWKVQEQMNKYYDANGIVD